MKKVILMGELGRKFGREHCFKVRSAAEAVRALCANFKDFRAHMINSDKENTRYKVLLGKRNSKDEKDLVEPVGDKTVIKFIPVIVGADSGTAKMFGGAALIGVGLIVGSFAPPVAAGAAASFSFAATAGGALVNIGLAVALSGVAQLLTPIPPSPKLIDRDEQNPSYSFNGPINTIVQGFPVPICYGELRVGSAVISAGITVEDPQS